MNEREKKIRLTGLILTTVCGLLTVYGILVLIGGWRSYSWQTVQGEIDSVRVEKRTTLNQVSKSRSGGEEFIPKVSFSFEIGDQSYSADNLNYFADPTFPTRREAEEHAQKFSSGKQVTVYVNPQDPAESVLTPGPNGTSYIPFSLGVAGIAGGLLLLCKPDWV